MFAKHWIKLTIMGALGFAIVGLSCSDEVADPVEPDLNKPLVVTHISSQAGSAIEIDGQEDAVWNDAKEFKYVMIDKDSVPHLLHLKALTDSTYFYLLARWNDPTEDIRPDLWLFNQTGNSWYRFGGQDFFCAMFDNGGNGAVGVNCYRMCHLDERGIPDAMVNPGTGMIDAWVWMAGLTNPVSTLEDMHYDADSSFRSYDENVTPGMNAYVRNYDGLENIPVWMPKDVPDHRSDVMFWEDVIDFIGSGLDSIPGYYLNARSAFFGTSKWEVDAKGLYNRALGQWVVEFRRKLDTGHQDDIAFVLGETINCAIAVSNNPLFNSPNPHIGRSPIEIRF